MSLFDNLSSTDQLLVSFHSSPLMDSSSSSSSSPPPALDTNQSIMKGHDLLLSSDVSLGIGDLTTTNSYNHSNSNVTTINNQQQQQQQQGSPPPLAPSSSAPSSTAGASPPGTIVGAVPSPTTAAATTTTATNSTSSSSASSSSTAAATSFPHSSSSSFYSNNDNSVALSNFSSVDNMEGSNSQQPRAASQQQAASASGVLSTNNTSTGTANATTRSLPLLSSSSASSPTGATSSSLPPLTTNVPSDSTLNFSSILNSSDSSNINHLPSNVNHSLASFSTTLPGTTSYSTTQQSQLAPTTSTSTTNNNNNNNNTSNSLFSPSAASTSSSSASTIPVVNQYHQYHHQSHLVGNNTTGSSSSAHQILLPSQSHHGASNSSSSSSNTNNLPLGHPSSLESTPSTTPSATSKAPKVGKRSGGLVPKLLELGAVKVGEELTFKVDGRVFTATIEPDGTIADSRGETVFQSTSAWMVSVARESDPSKDRRFAGPELARVHRDGSYKTLNQIADEYGIARKRRPRAGAGITSARRIAAQQAKQAAAAAAAAQAAGTGADAAAATPSLSSSSSSYHVTSSSATNLSLTKKGKGSSKSSTAISSSSSSGPILTTLPALTSSPGSLTSRDWNTWDRSSSSLFGPVLYPALGEQRNLPPPAPGSAPPPRSAMEWLHDPTIGPIKDKATSVDRLFDPSATAGAGAAPSTANRLVDGSLTARYTIGLPLKTQNQALPRNDFPALLKVDSWLNAAPPSLPTPNAPLPDESATLAVAAAIASAAASSAAPTPPPILSDLAVVPPTLGLDPPVPLPASNAQSNSAATVDHPAPTSSDADAQQRAVKRQRT